ncbi:MAG: hypothetical protein SGI74_00385 [Oligoflexia bacterium]|nr:hypothetical protein [Oligoflexia bacterium]
MNLFTALALLIFINPSFAQAQIISPFGTKPIQLSIGSDGVKQRKEPGYICDIKATVGGGQYSEWGETEKDARTIVKKTCSDKSGLLLCIDDKITCKQEK